MGIPMKNELIIVRGGGDLATGIIHRLHSAGFPVLILEVEKPAAIRRQVSFCEAIYEATATVEGVTAVKINDISEIPTVHAENQIPILVDPDGHCIPALKPAMVIDAIIAKKNLGTDRSMAPVTVAVGPGFTAGEDVDFVIESMRGHNLGRIFTSGTALPDTKVPGNIGGYTSERVLHAEAAGIMRNICHIGDIVKQGQHIAEIITEEGAVLPVPATIPGIIRGLIRDGYVVTKGFKIADIDPREDQLKNCFTISDKARCIAGSALEIACAKLL